MKTLAQKLLIALALLFAGLPANSGQIIGYLTDVYGNGIVGVNVYASDGLGHNYSTATTGGGYYSVVVTNSTYNVSVDCGQLTARGFYCAGGNSATVSGGSVEVDFTTTPVNTAAYAFTTLHSFLATATSVTGLSTNGDGASPYGELLLAGSTLFGTAQYGRTNGAGTVFAVNTNISNFTNVYTFSKPATNSFGVFTNSDGGIPEDALILSSNILYGTAYFGGTNGNGTVFAVNTNGTGYRVLHTFTTAATNGLGLLTNTDGANPSAGVVLFSNVLYGTATWECTNGTGAVFALNTNGTFAVLHSFTALDAATQTTNVDGANPYAGLVLSGGVLYGTAEAGGAGFGTIFAVHTNSMGFTVLHSFTGGNDGANPFAGLILVSNTLYGVASAGGHWSGGTLFAINTNGTGFTVLQSFAGGDGGANPYGGLIFSSNVLYGTTVNGGSYSLGTVFAFNVGTTNFAVLHAFTGGNDGANPYDGLVLSGNTLYGTTSSGGSTGSGTVFGVSIKALPQSPVISAPAHLSNNQFQMLVAGVAGQNYTVQMTTNLASTNWSSIYLTNPSSGTFLFTDPNATNKQRSYRVWVGP